MTGLGRLQRFCDLCIKYNECFVVQLDFFFIFFLGGAIIGNLWRNVDRRKDRD